MRRLIVAVALVAACRGDREPAPSAGSAAVSVVPYLPQSPDGAEELRAIDQRVAIHRDEPLVEIALLLDRASLRGHVEDYVEALARSAELVEHAPDERDAWALRTRALAAVHDFAAAREALAKVKALDPHGLAYPELATSIDEAAGDRTRALVMRDAAAKSTPNPATLTMFAASLTLAGRYDDAIALIPRAAKLVHDNSPELFSWLLFQWGRIYEQKGDFAAARQLYAASVARLPGYLEATTHLAQTMLATGDTPAATKLVREALAADRHPALLELGAQLQLATREDAKAEWDRYVQALPKAFADHAARFYLGVGADPQVALRLAQQNLANREVAEARELVVLAALAANDPATACTAAGPLVNAPVRAHRFAAWRALARCGRQHDADRLAKDLGITP